MKLHGDFVMHVEKSNKGWTLEILISWMSTVLSLIALILSVVVTYLVLKQTKTLHETTHEIALEEFERSRFDMLSAAVSNILLSVGEIKADFQPYWASGPDSFSARASWAEQLEGEMRVHRSIERLRANRKSLEIALVGLPTVGGKLGSPDSQRFVVNLHLASSWLDGSVMACYFALLTKTLESQKTQIATDNAVFLKIENEWDAKRSSRYLKEDRVAYLEAVRDNWLEKRKMEDAAQLDALQNPGPYAAPVGVMDEAPNIAFYFLENAERDLVESAMSLSRAYSDSQ